MVAHEIGVDGLVMVLSDAKPADGYRDHRQSGKP